MRPYYIDPQATLYLGDVRVCLAELPGENGHASIVPQQPRTDSAEYTGDDAVSAQGPVRASEGTKADWETPWPLFDAVDRRFHFTLDAAASAANRKCERYLTEEENALAADAIDQVVWCNPPYGRGLSEWVAACRRWEGQGSTVVALLPANTDTEWFRGVWDGASAIWFLQGRINFVGSRGGNTGGSMLAIYRDDKRSEPAVSLWNWRQPYMSVRRLQALPLPMPLFTGEGK